jgi:phosphoglycolate phosphatase
MAKLVVFDLDGTLVNSLPDLAAAINYMRHSFGLEPLDEPAVQKCIGDGIKNLVRRAVAGAEVDFDEALPRMKNFYAEHLLDQTCLFPGVADTMKTLGKRGMKIAVVTNKNYAETMAILRGLAIDGLCDDIIGGDSGFPLKPEPDSLICLQKKYAVDKSECWMIGDHHTDLESGRRAGFKRIFCKYGFGCMQDEKPDHLVENFAEIINILCGN